MSNIEKPELGGYLPGIDLAEQQYNELLLENIKLEMKEMSSERAELIYVGELRGNTPPEHWTGTISLAKRLESGEITEDELNEALGLINSCYVPVKLGAPKRCVDGRSVEGYDDKDPDSYGRGLGPQVQGGTEGDVIGSRLAKGYEPGATYNSDLKKYAKESKSKFGVGGHIDNRAKLDEGKTGCGQRDGEERRLPVYNDDRYSTVISRLSDTYGAVDLEQPKGKAEELKANAAELDTHADEYFADKSEATKTVLRLNPNGLEKLVGVHNEAAIVVNFDEDWTLHRDHFAALTGNKIHCFGLDGWDIVNEHGEDAYFVLADAVNTTMDLTDGTIKLFIRRPKQAKTPEDIAA